MLRAALRVVGTLALEILSRERGQHDRPIPVAFFQLGFLPLRNLSQSNRMSVVGPTGQSGLIFINILARSTFWLARLANSTQNVSAYAASST